MPEEPEVTVEPTPAPEPEQLVNITYTVENTGFTLVGQIGKDAVVPLVTVDGVEATANKG